MSYYFSNCNSYRNHPLAVDEKEAPKGYLAVDEKEAPKGYIPVLKSSVVKDNSNVCNYCDWRTDFSISSSVCSCMSDKRKDGCSVVFKKIARSK